MENCWEKTKDFVDTYIYDIQVDDKPKSFYSIDLISSICRVPIYWIIGFLFAPCFVVFQRMNVLGDRFNEDYRFCQNAYGKCWCPKIAKIIPLPCLLFEAFCCTGCATSGNRAGISKKHQLKNRNLEICIILTVALLMLFSLFGALLGLAFDAFLLAQQQNELDYRRTHPHEMIEV